MLDPARMSPKVRDAAAALVQRAWGWACQVGLVGPSDARGRRFQHLGPASAIAFPPGPWMGEGWIRIGAGSLIGPHVALSAGMWPGEALAPPTGAVISIGDRCNIGRGSSLVGRRRIEIGDDVTTGPNVYVTDHNHTYADPDLPIARQWPSEDEVVIGPGCWLGAGAVVLPGTRLGRNVVVAAGAVVRGEVEDHCVVAGAPARVVRRRTADGWDPPLRPVELHPPAGWGDDA